MLNANQRRAVELVHKPLLIVAGAGTGKTTVLVEKIRYLIEQKKVSPESILILTFTEKSAREMEERVDEKLPYGYAQLWISTFHSFADRILRNEMTQLGLSPLYRLMSRAESILFLREHLFMLELKKYRPLGNPHKFLESLFDYFSRLKDEDVDPKAYHLFAKSLKRNKKQDDADHEQHLELARAYERYQALKQKKQMLDFGDLQYYLLQLFRERNAILAKYRKQFKYVMIDEFQDTNIAQFELIKLLCSPRVASAKWSPRLTVVGDDSQAIYKFRGASISNILSFMNAYKDAKQITLHHNYRSPQQILDSAYTLIKNNDPDTLEARLGISKELIATREQVQSVKQPVALQMFDHGEDEADFVAKEIKRLTKKENRSYRDFAVLVRSNNHTTPFIRSLLQHGIPYQLYGPGMLFRQSEVKDLISYLNVLADVDDSVSMYRVLSMDIFQLDPQDIALLLSFAKKTNLSLLYTIRLYTHNVDAEISKQYSPYLPKLSKATSEKLKKMYEMIQRHLGLIKKESAGQLLFYFLEDTGYLAQIARYKSERDERIALNISKFFEKLKEFETTQEDTGVHTVSDYIKLQLELGESPTATEVDKSDLDAVYILTVHAAKGLEFPVVFLVNLSQGRFPTYERSESIPVPDALIKETLPSGNYHLQEERRLFYVAMTRAKDRLYFSASRLYSAEAKRERKISQFIPEAIGNTNLAKILEIKKEEKQQLAMFDYKKEPPVVPKPNQAQKQFSFTQIDTYHLCPLRYKYNYVLRIPVARGAAASFGESVHKSLELFYQEFQTNRQLDIKRLLERYQESWIPLGYTSQMHEKSMKEEGKRMLKAFFETFHKKNLAIMDVEKTFKLKVDSNITVTGKIDRVDKLPRNGLEIIDYKTGKKPSDASLQKSLQLSLYLLAASSRGMYNKPVGTITLTFYYLQENLKISFKKTGEDLQMVQKTVKDTVAQIHKGRFPARIGRHCFFCPFFSICEAWT